MIISGSGYIKIFQLPSGRPGMNGVKEIQVLELDFRAQIMMIPVLRMMIIFTAAAALPPP